jgi:hypothetical protein
MVRRQLELGAMATASTPADLTSTSASSSTAAPASSDAAAAAARDAVGGTSAQEKGKATSETATTRALGDASIRWRRRPPLPLLPRRRAGGEPRPRSAVPGGWIWRAGRWVRGPHPPSFVCGVS